METNSSVAGDPIPAQCAQIEVRVGELKQLFNAIDPSPFRERDLSPEAEEFIVGWAQEAPRDAKLALVVHLERGAGPANEALELRAAIHEFFTHEAIVAGRRLRLLFRVGRTSLVIGVAFLASAVMLGQLLAKLWEAQRIGDLLAEVMLIGGWVAMWRPLEIFLYDWWPILAEVRLFRRLAAMPVRIIYGAGAAPPEAWRNDWPAAPMRPDGIAR